MTINVTPDSFELDDAGQLRIDMSRKASICLLHAYPCPLAEYFGFVHQIFVGKRLSILATPGNQCILVTIGLSGGSVEGPCFAEDTQLTCLILWVHLWPLMYQNNVRCLKLHRVQLHFAQANKTSGTMVYRFVAAIS